MPKKKKILIASGGLLILLLIILFVPKIKCKPSQKKTDKTGTVVSKDEDTVVDTNEELIDEVDDTAPYPAQMYLRMAIEYLAGEAVDSAVDLPADEIVTADIVGSNIEMSETEWEYDADEDMYLLPVMPNPGTEKRPIVEVTLEYDEYPYQAIIYIDTLKERVASWEIGQR